MGPILSIPWEARVWLNVANGWRAYGSERMARLSEQNAVDSIREANPEWWPTVLA